MSALEKYKARYERGGCTIEQLKQLVALGILAKDEYKEITGKRYVALKVDDLEASSL